MQTSSMRLVVSDLLGHGAVVPRTGQGLFSRCRCCRTIDGHALSRKAAVEVTCVFLDESRNQGGVNQAAKSHGVSKGRNEDTILGTFGRSLTFFSTRFRCFASVALVVSLFPRFVDAINWQRVGH